MIDARNVYRKVTRKIYDFSPEQQQNLQAIVWLYRGQTEKYLDLLAGYQKRVLQEGSECFQLLENFVAAVRALASDDAALSLFQSDIKAFDKAVTQGQTTAELEVLAKSSRELIKQTNQVYRLAAGLDDSRNRDINRARKAADEARKLAEEQLKQVHYFWRQARWLIERFPDAELCDVEGLVKLVARAEIEANDWSLTPGRYVGVAPEEEDEDFDFGAAMREIHLELERLNDEAVGLAATIKKNFEGLGV